MGETSLMSLATQYAPLRVIPRVVLPQGEDISSSLRFSITPRWVVFKDGRYTVEKTRTSATRCDSSRQSSFSVLKLSSFAG